PLRAPGEQPLLPPPGAGDAAGREARADRADAGRAGGAVRLRAVRDRRGALARRGRLAARAISDAGGDGRSPQANKGRLEGWLRGFALIGTLFRRKVVSSTSAGRRRTWRPD